MPVLPFPHFEPDRSPFRFESGDNLLNVLPVADGWGPMPEFVEVSAALPSECLGAVYVRDANENFRIFAGTATDLYRLNTSSAPYTWDEVSKSTGAYSVPVDDRWSFTPFGGYLVANQLGDNPQFIDVTAGSKFTDLTGAPVARYSWAMGDFLTFGYLDGRPDAIQWSGYNDVTFWTNALRGADSQVLPDGYEIMGGIGHPQGGYVIMRNAMHLMQFAPASGFTFTRTTANKSRGAIAPQSIVEVGPGNFYYLSADGFFGGVEGNAIGAQRVDDWFFANADLDYLYNVRGMADPYRKIVWWRFRTVDGSFRLLGYHWQLDRWCQSDENLEEAAALLTPGITWDGLDTLYASIDAVNVPFDSLLFAGGQPVFAAFTADHKLAFATGQNKAATIETATVELAQGKRALVKGGRAITDATGFTAQIGTAPRHGDAVTYKAAVSPSARSGYLPFRADGRLHRERIVIPQGTNWTIASGIDLDAVETGQS